jgi:hypothetical protein
MPEVDPLLVWSPPSNGHILRAPGTSPVELVPCIIDSEFEAVFAVLILSLISDLQKLFISVLILSKLLLASIPPPNVIGLSK